MQRLAIAAIALLVTAVSLKPAEAQGRLKVGVLNCDISAGLGLIIGVVADGALPVHPRPRRAAGGL